MKHLRYHGRNFRLSQPCGTVGGTRQQVIEPTEISLSLGILCGGVWPTAL